MEGINVLSLFDGISCGQIALERAGVKVNKYFASEIDKHATKVTQYNYPDTIQLGDVTKVKVADLPKIDLLLGGSPCQGFSCAGKELNFQDPRSGLFFEYVRILEECSPSFFLLENVVMKKQFEEIITSYIKCEPVLINSALFSAQNRKRLYWTNLKVNLNIADKNIWIDDILDSFEMINPASIRGRPPKINGKWARMMEVRTERKSNCLTTVGTNNILTSLPAGRYANATELKLPFRFYSKEELCKLQTIPEGYLNQTSYNQAVKMTGNCWTVDVIAHIFGNMPNMS